MTNSDLILAPGENSRVGQQFAPNLTLAWLKTQVAMTNRRIVWKAPNTILGVIPAGYAEHSMPVGAIASVSVDTRFHAGRAVTGLLVVILGFILMGASVPLGLLMVIVGLLPLANSATAELTVMNNGGGSSSFGVSVLEKTKLEQFRSKVNEILYSGGAGGGYGAPPAEQGYGAR